MDYKNGKIYTIRSAQTDKYYIGSTCSKLSKRLSEHKNSYRKHKKGRYHYVTSFDIIKYDDCYVELLLNYPCNDKNELNRKEGELIRKYNNDVVNKRIEGRTKKEYFEDHKEHFKQYHGKYYQDNKTTIRDNRNKYRDENKEKVRDAVKASHLKYKEKYKAAGRKKYTCECGKTFVISCKARHERSAKHIKFINNQ